LALPTGGVNTENKHYQCRYWFLPPSKGVFMDLIRIILSVLLPPLGVFLQVGLGKHFWLNILLTFLGYIPGIVHAVWVIAKY
jgi:uncharacterized membrane protein YqaE (UPF0057 family)